MTFLNNEYLECLIFCRILFSYCHQYENESIILKLVKTFLFTNTMRKFWKLSIHLPKCVQRNLHYFLSQYNKIFIWIELHLVNLLLSIKSLKDSIMVSLLIEENDFRFWSLLRCVWMTIESHLRRNMEIYRTKIIFGA